MIRSATILVVLVALELPAFAQAPPIGKVPTGLAPQHAAPLNRRRATLIARLIELKRRIPEHNQKCRSFAEGSALAAECRAAGDALRADRLSYKEAVEAFNRTLKRVSSVSARCRTLRDKRGRLREALVGQRDASLLISEGSQGRGAAILQRAGSVAARLLKLGAEHYSAVTKVLTKAADLASDPAIREAAAGGAILAVTRQNVVPAWNALNAAQSAKSCADEVKQAAQRGSTRADKGLALAKCAQLAVEIGKFVSKHGKQLERIGDHLGLVVAVAEIAKETHELAQELKDFREYTEENPAKAGERIERLDEEQKAVLKELADCEKELDALLSEQGANP